MAAFWNAFASAGRQAILYNTILTVQQLSWNTKMIEAYIDASLSVETYQLIFDIHAVIALNSFITCTYNKVGQIASYYNSVATAKPEITHTFGGQRFLWVITGYGFSQVYFHMFYKKWWNQNVMGYHRLWVITVWVISGLTVSATAFY